MYPKHDEDFYGWTQSMSSLLRQRKYENLDHKNLEDEIESLGLKEKQLLERQIENIIYCLLYHDYFDKRKYFPLRHDLQLSRLRAHHIWEENKSLESKIPSLVKHAYQCAKLQIELLLPQGMPVPEQCPYTFEDCLSDHSVPKEI